MGDKLPAFQFYPGDWLRDPVAGCSLSAQGLWLRMMILAHDSERYGYLSVNGLPIPSEALARRCSCDSLAQYTLLLAELDAANVPSRTPEGIIFSRRMVKDAKTRAANAERQRRFYENRHQKPNGEPNAMSNGPPNAPSSSSSSSSFYINPSSAEKAKDKLRRKHIREVKT